MQLSHKTGRNGFDVCQSDMANVIREWQTFRLNVPDRIQYADKLFTATDG